MSVTHNSHSKLLFGVSTVASEGHTVVSIVITPW